MKTIYVDITELFLYNGKTGIQRVVRNICNQLNELTDHPNEIRYAVAINGTYLELETAFVGKVIDYNTDVGPKYSGTGSNNIVAIGKKLLSSFPIIYRFVQEKYAAYKVDSYIRNRYANVIRGRINFDSDSLVLIMDSFWNGSTTITAAKRAKRQGATIACMIHDVISISHPHLYLPALARTFKWHCDRILKFSDQIVTTTNYSKSEVLRVYPFLKSQNVHVIRLGADFSHAVENQSVPRQASHFLTVGTVEIRKGHENILAAFELLWERDIDVRWTIIGAKGWKTEGFIKKVENSHELGKRLHWLQNVDDEELRSNYLSCNSTIIASEIEGYGLPIIEALMLKSGVLASDIPVFREVGGDHAIYFDRNDPEVLAQQIEILVGDIDIVPRPDIQCPSWQDAAQDIFAALTK